jgi:CRP/FNR family cyclic AMP-dependent transcriptional regulator
VLDPSLASDRPQDTLGSVRRSFARTCTAGEVIFEPGDEGRSLFVIQAGEVELSRPEAGRFSLVARLGPGDLFGELSVLLGGRRRAKARAVGAVQLLEIEGATLQAMCLERPEIGLRLTRKLADRIIHLEQRLMALGADDLVRPVVRVLVRRAEREGGTARVVTTLRGIAKESGLSMLEAHRALQQLLEEKLVKLADEVVEIPDLEALLSSVDGL